MDLKQVEIVLNKYWEGDTTLEEEKQLQQFFTYGEVPENLQVYRPLFSLSEIDMEPDLGLDFDRQLIDKLQGKKGAKNRVSWRIAAIGIILVGLSIGLFKMDKEFAGFNPTVDNRELAEDTFDNPRAALAETKQALFLVSAAMNKGSKPVLNIAKLDVTSATNKRYPNNKNKK